MTKSTALIVFEKKGGWAPAFRRELASRDIVIRETRSLAGCWREIEAAPHSFIVFEVNEKNVVDVCDVLRRVDVCFPAARTAIVGTRNLASCEWTAREAGARHVVFSPRCIGPLARMVVRHKNALAMNVGEPPDDLLAGLPWG